MTDFRRYLQDRASRDTGEKKWLKGKRISSDDLKTGRGSMEKISAAEAFGKRSDAPASTKPAANTMLFGKFKGMLLVDVRDDQPGYWSWCCREIAGFETKMRKAGLICESDDNDLTDEDDFDSMTVNR